MNEHEGFLHEVQTRPDDDAPRLVYADWLEENGQPERAEFIRVQIELARMTQWDRRRQPLTRREYELFARHGNRWSAPLIGHVMRWQYRRGFVEQVKASVAQLRGSAEILSASFPVRDLHVKYPEQNELPELAAVLNSIGHIERLDLSHGRIGDEGLQVLLDSPAAPGLHSLKLPWCELTDDALRLLAGTKQLPALAEIDLSGNKALTEAAIANFLATCELPKLSRIDWEYHAYDWSDRKLAALGGSPLLPRLKVLTGTTYQPKTPDAAVTALLAQGRLDSVEHFRVRGVTLKDVEKLANNPSLRRVRCLDLSESAFGTDGVTALLASPLADSLEELRLRTCHIDSRGSRALARSERLAHLVYLDLANNSIGDGACRALADAQGLPNLQGLNLSETDLRTKGARALVNSPLANRLGYLNVEITPDLGRGKQLLIDCFGGRLDYDGQDDFYSMAWAAAHAKAHPPRCLSGFAVRSDPPLAGRLLESHVRGDLPGTAIFEVCHPDQKQRPVLLVYWHQWGRAKDERVAIPPMAIRWEPSGEVVELFDSEQHGFAGELDFSATATGSGPRVEWKCPHRGCREHSFFACFCYWGDPPDRRLDRYLPPQEHYRGFELYAYCHHRDGFECVGGFECK
jgi:uncharacterized protein (TIGR02996 family)